MLRNKIMMILATIMIAAVTIWAQEKELDEQLIGIWETDLGGGLSFKWEFKDDMTAVLETNFNKQITENVWEYFTYQERVYTPPADGVYDIWFDYIKFILPTIEGQYLGGDAVEIGGMNYRRHSSNKGSTILGKWELSDNLGYSETIEFYGSGIYHKISNNSSRIIEGRYTYDESDGTLMTTDEIIVPYSISEGGNIFTISNNPFVGNMETNFYRVGENCIDVETEVTVNIDGYMNIDDFEFSKQSVDGKFLLNNSCDFLVITFPEKLVKDPLTCITVNGKYAAGNQYIVRADEPEVDIGFLPINPEWVPTAVKFKIVGDEYEKIEYSYTYTSNYCTSPITKSVERGFITKDTIISSHDGGNVEVVITPKAGFVAVLNGKKSNKHSVSPWGVDEQGIPVGAYEGVYEISFVEGEEMAITQITKPAGKMLFKETVVSDKMEIIIDKEFVDVRFVVYDMTGNVVFVGAIAPNRPLVWDLRNNNGRFVANGSYQVVVEAKDRNGVKYRWSEKLGVKR